MIIQTSNSYILRLTGFDSLGFSREKKSHALLIAIIHLDLSNVYIFISFAVYYTG